jgi:hypothetical protein
MAVDQAGRQRAALRVDGDGGAARVAIGGAADRRDPAVLGNDRVGIEDRVFQRARQQQADIADDELSDLLFGASGESHAGRFPLMGR